LKDLKNSLASGFSLLLAGAGEEREDEGLKLKGRQLN